MRKVEVKCPGDPERWYGNSDEAEGSSLFDTLATIAEADLESTLGMAGNIDDPVTRIRGIAFVVRSVLKNPQKAKGVDSTPSRKK